MPMKNPAHPGVTPRTLNNIVNGNAGISPEMAIRLTKAFGGRIVRSACLGLSVTAGAKILGSTPETPSARTRIRSRSAASTSRKNCTSTDTFRAGLKSLLPIFLPSGSPDCLLGLDCMSLQPSQPAIEMRTLRPDAR
jgi:hypothetical protein